MRRYIQFDALRGFAAFSVFLTHVQDVYPQIWYYVNFTPLRIVAAGHAAVILFFILSGFVLSLQLFAKKNISYKEFFIRRFFRIYFPYVVCIIIGFIVFSLLKPHPLENLSLLANVYTTTHFSWSLFFSHLLMVGNFSNNAINPVIWTLIVEMRMAFIFPFLVKLIDKLSLKLLSLFVSGFLVVSFVSQSQAVQYSSDFFETIHFIIFFALGIILAKYKNQLIDIYNRCNYKNILFIVGLFFYAYGSAIALFFQKVHAVAFITQSLSDWVLGGGVLLLMTAILSQEERFAFLESRLPQFLGKISFSFYLYHFLIILVLLNLFYSSLWSLFIILPVSLCISVIISHLSYSFVEIPSNNLGKKLVMLLG